VTPTTLTGGTTVNTVPAQASLAVDVRAATVAEMERVDRALHALTAVGTEAGVDVTVEHSRPPLERERSARLFDVARATAATLGLPALDAVAVGGGSDGNITGALGIDTLDGLGAVGGGAHAEGEWVSISGMTERAALLAALVEHLVSEEQGA
jgi:glutamate carboxypeptidase